jgi:raffinose/stachyose/melibiose transport system permease protein
LIGQRRITPWLYVAPALILFTGTVVVPIFWSLSLGFFDWDGLGPLVFSGFHNFIQMFNDQVLRQAFVNNLVFALLGTTVQFVAGLTMAILLLSITTFRNLIRVAYFIPCVISSVAVSQIFSQLFSADPVGVLDAILGNFVHGTPPAVLSDPHLALVIVTLVDAYKFCAIYMVIYYAAFIAIDEEVLNAAELDGCNWWQQYVYIKFPLIKAVIAVTIVMLVSGTLKGFDVSFILTNGGPGASSELVSTYLYKMIFGSSNFGYGSAISIGLVVECLVIIVILRRLLQRDPEE